MILKGTCKCGTPLLFNAHEDGECEQLKNLINKFQPNGTITCKDCVKIYTEQEFRTLDNLHSIDIPDSKC